MEVIKFDIEVAHAGRKLRAGCQAFQTYSANYPTYRVALSRPKLGEPEIFILYKVDWPELKFSWHELQGTKQLIAKSIAKALTKYTSTHEHSFPGRESVRKRWKKSGAY